MTGIERAKAALAGGPFDRLPVMPIMHAGLAPLVGVSFGEFFADAGAMARVMVDGARQFGFDGVQLSQGVTGEAEALGAAVEQPPDAAPVLREHLLDDLGKLDSLRDRDPCAGGRMPLFFEALERIVEEIGRETFVLATLRGPLLAASQLRGVEQILMDLVDCPEAAGQVLDFTADMAVRLGRRVLETGAHGLLLGEATCSPNFISPTLYRDLVQPRHRQVVAHLKEAGWQAVGFHICGSIQPIIEDILATGADFFDVDYQVPVGEAIGAVGGRAVMRGNLDPSAVFRFGTADEVRSATRALCEAVGGAPWIASSGCDIPPGTPAENITAFVETVAACG